MSQAKAGTDQQNRQLSANYKALQPAYTKATQDLARERQEKAALQDQLSEAQTRLNATQEGSEIDPEEVDIGKMATEVLRLGRELDSRDATIVGLTERQGLHERGLKLALSSRQREGRESEDQSMVSKIRAQFGGNLGDEAEGVILDAWKSKDPERIAQVSHQARDAAYEIALATSTAATDGQSTVGGAGGGSGGGGSAAPSTVDRELLKAKYPDARDRMRAEMRIGLKLEAPPA
jgi:hypothetical protein